MNMRVKFVRSFCVMRSTVNNVLVVREFAVRVVLVMTVMLCACRSNACTCRSDACTCRSNACACRSDACACRSNARTCRSNA